MVAWFQVRCTRGFTGLIDPLSPALRVLLRLPSPSLPLLFHPSPLLSHSLPFPDTASQIAAVALGPTPADVPSKYFQRNAEITDIDARLEALQQFLHTAQAAS